MKYILGFISLIIALVALLIIPYPETSMAQQVTPGAACVRENEFRNVSGVDYLCVKIDGVLQWRKGYKQPCNGENICIPSAVCDAGRCKPKSGSSCHAENPCASGLSCLNTVCVSTVPLQGSFNLFPYQNVNRFSIPVPQAPGQEPLPGFFIGFTIPAAANVPANIIRVKVKFSGVPVVNHPNNEQAAVMLLAVRSFMFEPMMNNFATQNVRNNEGDGTAVYTINKADLKFGNNNRNTLSIYSLRGNNNARNTFMIEQVTFEGATRLTFSNVEANR